MVRFLTNDICGIAGVICSWLSLIFVNYVVVFEIVVPWTNEYYWTGSSVLLMFQSVVVLAWSTHLRCVFGDPGSISMYLV
jgi:hypothetical protein